jgi:hypothetical protein
MKHNKFKLCIITLLLFLSACGSNTLITKQSSGHEKNNDLKQTLCIYKKVKGIAEVTAISKHTYQFKFYLGDDIFKINKDDIETENKLNIGDEFKAVKEVMINKAERQDCLPVDFHLIL